MVKLYLVGMVSGDMSTYKRLDLLISKLKPDIITVEETQSDIDSLMENVKVNAYDKEYYDEKRNVYLEEFPNANVYTLREFIQDEIWYYQRLNQSRSEGVRIFGLDDEDFDYFRYAEAEHIYSERKKEFLSGIFSARPKDARVQIQKEYNAIKDQESYVGDRPYFSVSDDELLKDYYEAQDCDTADRLKELVDEESQNENEEVDTVIIYLCDITHFDNGYLNISMNLNYVEHSKRWLCDF